MEACGSLRTMRLYCIPLSFWLLLPANVWNKHKKRKKQCDHFFHFAFFLNSVHFMRKNSLYTIIKAQPPWSDWADLVLTTHWACTRTDQRTASPGLSEKGSLHSRSLSIRLHPRVPEGHDADSVTMGSEYIVTGLNLNWDGHNHFLGRKQ